MSWDDLSQEWDRCASCGAPIVDLGDGVRCQWCGGTDSREGHVEKLREALSKPVVDCKVARVLQKAERGDRAIALLRIIADDEPYVGRFGPEQCFFCGLRRPHLHQDDCPWAEARKLLTEIDAEKEKG